MSTLAASSKLVGRMTNSSSRKRLPQIHHHQQQQQQPKHQSRIDFPQFQRLLLDKYGQSTPKQQQQQQQEVSQVYAPPIKITVPPSYHHYSQTSNHADHREAFHLQLLTQLRQVSQMDQLRSFVNHLTTVVITKHFVPHPYLLETVVNKMRYLLSANHDDRRQQLDDKRKTTTTSASSSSYSLFNLSQQQQEQQVHVNPEQMLTKLLNRVLLIQFQQVKNLEQAKLLFHQMTHSWRIECDERTFYIMIGCALALEATPQLAMQTTRNYLEIMKQRNIPISDRINRHISRWEQDRRAIHRQEQHKDQ